MIIDVHIVSYNRPDYLEQLLTSLSQQEKGNFRLRNIHLFQDGPKHERLEEDGAKISACIDLFRKIFPGGVTHVSGTNVGINGNYAKLWESMASITADASVVFEDDLILSPLYMTVMSMLLAHARQNPNVGLVSAIGAMGVPRERQRERIRALIPMGTDWGIHRWGWGITQELVREFLPFKRLYFKLADRLHYADDGAPVPSADVRRLLLRFVNSMDGYRGPNHFQVDTLYDVFATALNRVNLSTYASYARSIGERGVHFNEDLYRRLGYAFSEMIDTAPDDFQWYHPQMMLDVLTLIRRFNANRNTNYNSGAFGSAFPFPHLHSASIVKYLYERIFEWPVDRFDLEAHNLMGYRPREQQTRPSDDIAEILRSDFDASHGLLGHSFRKTKLYATPYAL